MASVKRNVKKPKDFYQHFLPMKYLDFPATDFKLSQQIFYLGKSLYNHYTIWGSFDNALAE